MQNTLRGHLLRDPQTRFAPSPNHFSDFPFFGPVSQESRISRPQFGACLISLRSVLFISIVVSATDPLICYEHPGGAGESVSSAPSLLCFQGGDHTGVTQLGTDLWKFLHTVRALLKEVGEGGAPRHKTNTCRKIFWGN